MKKIKLMTLLALSLVACAGTGIKKVVVDSSPQKPDWVDDQRLSYEDGDRFYFRAQQTVRGDQRVQACNLVGSNDNRERMIREMVEGLKGRTDEAQTSASENAELVIGKVRSGEWSGKLYGFKDEGYYFERYQIRDEITKQVTERIDCFTLSSIGRADFSRTRTEILNQLIAVDQKVKDAITRKQTDFFDDQKVDGETKRDPASTGGKDE